MVLIIDDDVVIRRTASAVLQRAGIRTQAVESAEEGIELLKEGPLPAVVLCDFYLPRMSGGDFVRIVRRTEAWKSVPTIILTGRAVGPGWEQAKVDSDAHMTKPFSSVELYGTVKRLMGLDDAEADSRRVA